MDGQLGHWSLNVADTGRAKTFFGAVFGWSFGAPGSEGGINVSDHWGGLHPASLNVSPAAYAVADAVKAGARIRELGGTTAELREYEAGPYLEAVDPAGSRFGVWQPAPGFEPPAQPPARAGDIAYFVQATPDLDRSRVFFADLFGWTYGAPGSAGGLPIEGSAPLGFLGPGDIAGALTFGVADAETAVAAIRAAGGTADDPIGSPYGPYSSAVDDQGTRFAIFQGEA
jgi:predicted enzyme related to lactoylglutathione lyase